MTLQPKKHPEYAILAELLKMAAEEYSNHGCNDYLIDNTPENLDFMRMAHEWNTQGDPEQPFDENISEDGKTIYTRDYYLMSYFAHLFEELAKQEPTP